MNLLRLLATFLVPLALVSCAGLGEKLPDEPPPLADMEEPVALLQEPDDEAIRVSLPAGGFSGVSVKEVAESLDDLVEGGEGVVVTRVVENSPGDFAGLKIDDILIEATPEGGETVELAYPSQWRRLELETAPGTPIAIVFDRADEEMNTELELAPRAHPAGRAEAERFREEDRVGVVLRTATEVEARRVGLPPGGGAVVVGMSARSPWRGRVRFKDLITAVDEKPVDHPNVVLEAIAKASDDGSVHLSLLRGEQNLTVDAPVSRRETKIEEVEVFPLFSHEEKRGRSETKVLLGLFGYEETSAAWEMTLLWFIHFGGGDADRLEEVKEEPQP